MPSRRDQIQSYQFAVKRVVAALVAREADPAASPLRRLVGAGFGSVMLAVIALAAIGVFGVLTGRSGSSWRDGSAVIIERETGAAYVYRDGRLIPTANFASALLLLQSTPKTVTVRRGQLAGVPRGPLVGIPNAPGALPDPKRLLAGGWTLCTGSTVDPSGKSAPVTTMLVGENPADGRPLADEGIIVKLPDASTLYLVWHNHRYRIADNTVVLEALTLRQEPQIVVGPAWLTALAQGRTIELVGQANRGQPVSIIPDLPDARAGQVLVQGATGEAQQFYLLGTEQLRPLTPLEASIVLAHPDTRTAYPGVVRPEARPLSAGTAAALAAARRIATAPAPSPDRPPDRRPSMARPSRSDAAVCTTFTGPDGTARLAVDVTPLAPEAGIATVQRTSRGIALADRVVVAAGRGAVVEALPAPDAVEGTYFLVTDVGTRYAVPSRQVLQMLGYGAVQPVRLAAGLVARLPEGPALDPAAAAAPVRSG